MSNIEVDLNNLPKAVHDFVQSVLTTCDVYNIPVSMPKKYRVVLSGLGCSGYFDENPLQFATACGGSYRKWLPVFIHESCHIDQWLEQSEEWTAKVPGFTVNPGTIFDEWLNYKIELPDDIKNAIIDYLVYLELDCEIRTVEKLKKYDFPVNMNEYIRMSNACIWGYRIISETRIWNHNYISDVLKRMPNHFDNDYSVLPNIMHKFIPDY
jgi:hypothetical protein